MMGVVLEDRNGKLGGWKGAESDGGGARGGGLN